jgi:hypothetical protein
MGTVPKEYGSVITGEQQAKGDKMTLKDLKPVMYQPWCQANGSTEEQQDTELI